MKQECQRLIEELQSPDPGTRAGAAAALGSLGAEAGDAVPFLFAALEDIDEPVRRQARIALERITSKDSFP